MQQRKLSDDSQRLVVVSHGDNFVVAAAASIVDFPIPRLSAFSLNLCSPITHHER